eukprot:Selendium_serpulae@DN2536_c0_g1_i2.p1
MARRYDSRTTTFSPEGRLFQIEYALEAINNAPLTIGVLAKDGVVLAADKMSTSVLLDTGKSREKIYTVDDHVLAAVAGLTADANILISSSRLYAQRHLFSYNEPIAVEQLIVRLCDQKQGYTQFGGLRPFGVSFLFAGWDRYYGFQLYQTDPSGNYSGWKGAAVGANNLSAQTTLGNDWNADLTLKEAQQLAAKVLCRSMDSTAAEAEKLEFAILYRDAEREKFEGKGAGGGRVAHRMLTVSEVDALMAEARREQQSEQERQR